MFRVQGNHWQAGSHKHTHMLKYTYVITATAHPLQGRGNQRVATELACRTKLKTTQTQTTPMKRREYLSSIRFCLKKLPSKTVIVLNLTNYGPEAMCLTILNSNKLQGFHVWSCGLQHGFL